ncbi:MAG: hypothetical protein ACT4PS_15375 [Betaproteobacteria bacterium]
MRVFQAILFPLLLSLNAVAFGQVERTDLRSQADAPGLARTAIQEGDVSLLFDYLRAAIRAASEGREPPPPPRELERRMDGLGSEIKARGTLAALVLLQTLEEQVKALRREGARPRPPSGALPPTVPYTPVSSRP